MPGRTIDSKRRERPVEATTLSQTIVALIPAPVRKEGFGGLTKCFRCGKLGYFAHNCKLKDAVAAVVSDNLGKNRGQST